MIAAVSAPHGVGVLRGRLHVEGGGKGAAERDPHGDHARLCGGAETRFTSVSVLVTRVL